MPQKIDKTTLEYLGEEVQYKIVKEFMEDKSLFKDLSSIIDQNLFTGQYLRMYVGTMLEYFHKYGETPSYSSMLLELKKKAHTKEDIEIFDAVVNKIRKTNSDGSKQTRETCTEFFKQKNFERVGLELLRMSRSDNCDCAECEHLIKDALEIGYHSEYEESKLYDGFEETLSSDFRITIPTGVDKLDDVLNGGIGKGELGAIVCASSVGKTSFTTSLAAYASTYKSEQNLNCGFKVLQIVFEDRIKQIQRKHFSKITQVEACNLSKEEYAAYVRETLENYEDKDMINNNLRIIRLKSGEMSVDYIVNRIKKHIDVGFRPDLVIVDYFECIKLTGPATITKWEKETTVMRKLESAANELNIAIWVPIQGNRDSMKTDLVTMDNGGGSIGKIQVAHIIITITRSKEDRDNNLATLRIDKNRAGSTDDFRTVFNNGTCTISTEGVEDVDNVQMFSTSTPFNQDDRWDKAEKLRREIFKEIKK